MAGHWPGECGKESHREGDGDGESLGFEQRIGTRWRSGHACIGYCRQGLRILNAHSRLLARQSLHLDENIGTTAFKQ